MTDTEQDAARWRFALEHGFPEPSLRTDLPLRWVAFSDHGKPHDGSTPNEAIDKAMVAVEGKHG
jgi:hypothetical protein